MRPLEFLALTEPLEVAAASEGLHFSGYAAVFNQPSDDLGGFRAIIRPGAFTKTLKDKRDVRMFLNHEDNIVLASTRAGTLRLAEDERGLRAEADLPDNEWGRPVRDAIERGDIHTMSIGFNTISDEPSDDGSVLYKKEIRLHEVSPITSWAAFPQTTASVYSLSALVGSLEAEPSDLDAAMDQFGRGAELTSEQYDLLSRALTALSPKGAADDANQAAFRHQHELALLELRLKVQ